MPPKKRHKSKIETLMIPYRLPVWDGGHYPTLKPAELFVRRVTVALGSTNEYDTSRELAAEFDLPPELIRHHLRQSDRTGDEKRKTSVLLIANEPGPFVVEEEPFLDEYFRTSVPIDAYDDPWQFYQPMAFDPDPRNGWLVRLGDETSGPQPRIDVTERANLIAWGENRELDFERTGGRVYLREGDYLRAETGCLLDRRSPGQRLPWDNHQLHELHMEIPHVKTMLADFRAGRPLPDTWVRVNLAYAIRRAWFLRQLYPHAEPDMVGDAIAHECSLFGENNRL